MHHRGEETDLGTSRSLTRLPFVPRNTVGKGRTEPRIIDCRPLFYILCVLPHDICIRYVLCVHWYVLSAPRCCYYSGSWLLDMCSLSCATCYVVLVIRYMLCVIVVLSLSCGICYVLFVNCSVLLMSAVLLLHIVFPPNTSHTT